VTDALATGEVVEHLFRRQAGRMVARLTRILGPGYVGIAEDAVQEALLRALKTWPHRGIPEDPGAWLFRVARNAAIDAVRRDHAFDQKKDGVVAELRDAAAQPGAPDAELDAEVRDDELRMIFMCCHPALSRDASVALSLKTVGGFGVPEIARAFLRDDATIAQRIVRAKRQIRAQRLTLDLPSDAELPRRLDAVLEVIYFMFNEGYAAHDGAELIRRDLCFEALRLGTLVASSPLAAPRVHALIALMALQAARLPARVDDTGELVLLEAQDRRRWDQDLIALGFHHFDRCMDGEEVTEYHVQAAIAATHARATDPARTDWPLILRFYDQLIALNPSPVVALNRAVALARVRGAAEALQALEPLEASPDLEAYHLFLAVRGQLLLEVGRRVEAVECFHSALECVCSEPERRFLRRLETRAAEGARTAD
jgi:RNA polymerase sigma-70 factor (ECF subfamily)